MEQALPSRVYAALIAHWAWHDVVDAFELDELPLSPAPLITNTAALELLLQQIKATTGLWIVSLSLTEIPVAKYVEALLADLERVRGPALHGDLLSKILNEYEQRLKELCEEDTILGLCRSVLDATVAAYKHYGVAVSADYVSGVAINLVWQREPPAKSFSSPFNGGAAVRLGCAPSCCKEEARQHLQELSVLLAPHFFDSSTLNSFVFALFHECVSHVMQGPYDGSKSVTPSSSSFAEGWMDKAALIVLRQVITRTPLIDGSELPHPARHEAFLSWGEILFEARHNKSQAKPFDLDALGRRIGKSAADLLIDFYRCHPRIHEKRDAYDIFIRLSTALNASDVTPIRRDHFVQHILGALRRSSSWPESVRAPAIRSLCKFATDEDLLRLLTRLQELFGSKSQ